MTDVRQFIQLLESQGELARVSVPVGLDRELSAVQYETLRRDGPALLFTHIPTHRDTWCRQILVGELASTRRVALMLGLPRDAAFPDITAALSRAFSNPLPPELVASGPVQQHVLSGPEVDLAQIPVPTWHPGDGGPYINTWCGVVTRDPETGVHNVGIYRGQVLGRNRIGVKLMPSKGWGVHFAKCRALGRSMPVAVFYGGHPALGFMAGCPIPEPPEYDLAGSIMGEPVRLVRCKTQDLLVPADAEIVIEGTISTDPATYAVEGPFGEWTGHYSVPQMAPVLVVDCITHRDDPVFRGCLACTESTVPRESAVTGRVGQCAIIRHILDRSGVAGVLDVETGPRRVPAAVFVKTDRRSTEQARLVAEALWGRTLNMRPISTVFVVNGEVDVHSLDSILNHISRLNYFGRPPRVFVERYEGGEWVLHDAVDKDQMAIVLTGSFPRRVLVDATLDPDTDMTADERRRAEVGDPCTPDWGDLSRQVAASFQTYVGKKP